MRARPIVGATLAVLGLALASLSLPVIISRECAVAAYVELADEVADSEEEAVDWGSLLAANPSVVAWCRVNGTSIDLPVCQASDEDPAFWLTHDLWGGESPAGTPYVDHRATASSRHLLCYGHHLAGTGGMFSDVYRCHEQDEFDGVLSGGLVWSTPDGGELRMRTLCASTQDMAFGDVQRFDFESTGEFRSWLDGMCNRSTAKVTDAGKLASSASRAITLVTCSSDLTGQRDRTLVTFVA